MASPTKPTMPMRLLGNTGLQTSVLGMGFWATFGEKPDLRDNLVGIDKAKECMRVARSGGINLFDNAETCAVSSLPTRAQPEPDPLSPHAFTDGEPRGASELIMGEALRQLRDEDPAVRPTLVRAWGGDLYCAQPLVPFSPGLAAIRPHHHDQDLLGRLGRQRAGPLAQARP